jgi:hypothetical protein
MKPISICPPGRKIDAVYLCPDESLRRDPVVALALSVTETGDIYEVIPIIPDGVFGFVGDEGTMEDFLGFEIDGERYGWDDSDIETHIKRQRLEDVKRRTKGGN